jgi:hypothetical protein
MIKRAPPHGSVRRIETSATIEGEASVTTYLVTLRDRETQTVVGYYNGAWTTDQRRALTVRRREAAEAHAARMRDCCPRNADVIKVEIAAADQHLPPALRPRTRKERDPRRASRSRSRRDR